jgi:hypothetical protein
MATTTPWGISQDSEKIAVGINSYSTAGHGGIKVSNGLYAAMPNDIKAHGSDYRKGWFEEDCEWALVVAAFPKKFNENYVYYALGTLSRWYPDIYQKYMVS